MRVTVDIPDEIYQTLVALAGSHRLTVEEWVPRHLAYRAAAYHAACEKLASRGFLVPGNAGGTDGADSDHQN